MYFPTFFEKNTPNSESMIIKRSWKGIITSEGPTSQWKKGTVNAALNSAAHFVGGNSFLNCSIEIKLLTIYIENIGTEQNLQSPQHPKHFYAITLSNSHRFKLGHLG